MVPHLALRANNTVGARPGARLPAGALTQPVVYACRPKYLPTYLPTLE